MYYFDPQSILDTVLLLFHPFYEYTSFLVTPFSWCLLIEGKGEESISSFFPSALFITTQHPGSFFPELSKTVSRPGPPSSLSPCFLPTCKCLRRTSLMVFIIFFVEAETRLLKVVLFTKCVLHC